MLKQEKFLTIVSRQSNLALRQSNLVRQQLEKIYPNIKVEIIAVTTKGDQILDQSLNKIGGKGLFVKELENYLLRDMADIAVHSLKDMPAELPSGLAIGAILERADPGEVFISDKYRDLSSLPEGAVVGTSSLRRQAQVLAQRPGLQIKPLRGNVETRINKLSNGEYDAIILAAAGLERLGLHQRVTSKLPLHTFLPAVGQGALAIEFKQQNETIRKLIEPLNHLPTCVCVKAERAMNKRLNGGCLAPIAGFACIENELLTLRGLVANIEGKIIYQAEASGSLKDAELIGIQVADELIAQGALKIIADLKHGD